MFTHKTFKITDEEVKIADMIFNYLGCSPINIFKPNSWRVLFIESKPFIDEDSFSNFQSFYSTVEEKELNIFDYPLHKGEEYLKIIGVPEYQNFAELMDKYYFSSTGGIAFGRNLKWALHSDAENSITFLGYDIDYTSIIEKVFSENKYVISKERVIEIFNEQKRFLQGDSSLL